VKSYSLAADSRAKLRAAYAHIPAPSDDYPAALVSLHSAFGGLPADLLREIFAFGRDPASPGVLVLDGLPIDEALPATPAMAAGERHGTIAQDGEKTLLGLAQLIGTPVGYLSEKDGNLVHHVVPMPGGEYTQSNRGSKVFLSYHNDSMYDPSLVFNSHNPDFLLLLCLRADRDGQARTLYADARKVVAELTPEVREILRQPRFLMAAPSNYTLLIAAAANGEKVWSNPVPVLTGPRDFPEIYIAANGVSALDPQAGEALDALFAACQKVGEQHAVFLKPGQAMLINNRKGVHARTQFKANYDGQDRWLLRANIRTSLWNIRDRATGQALVFA
jgi:L-asparagine oxygenase